MDSQYKESEQEIQVRLIRESETRLSDLELKMHQMPVLVTAERSRLYHLKCDLNKMMGK